MRDAEGEETAWIGGGGGVRSCLISVLSLVLLAFTGSIISTESRDVTGGQIGAACDLPTISLHPHVNVLCEQDALFSLATKAALRKRFLSHKRKREFQL